MKQNFTLINYYLRWWRLPIEERACRETDLGGGDYYLRNSGLPPSCNRQQFFTRTYYKAQLGTNTFL